MTDADLAIRKTITVECSPEHAFSVFTDGIADWWPLDTHAVSAMSDPPQRAQSAKFEEGELYEVMPDGSKAHWADVVAWDPPRRLVLAWKVNPDAVAATDVEVTFTPVGEATRVELVHSGWDKLGKDAREGYESYDRGWIGVFGAYADALKR